MSLITKDSSMNKEEINYDSYENNRKTKHCKNTGKIA